MNQADIVEQRELEERILDKVVELYNTSTTYDGQICIPIGMVHTYVTVRHRNNTARENEWKGALHNE